MKVTRRRWPAGSRSAALAFVAVVREGIETALFLFAATKGTAIESAAGGRQLLGALLGLALAVGSATSCIKAASA